MLRHTDFLDDPSLLECILGFQNYSTNLLSFPFWQMLDFSAQDFYDIGQQLGCNKLSDEAAFVVLNFHMNTVPSKIKAGVCLPLAARFWDCAQRACIR